MNKPTKKQPSNPTRTGDGHSKDHSYQLSWMEDDIANRLGFRGGRYTSLLPPIADAVGWGARNGR